MTINALRHIALATLIPLGLLAASAQAEPAKSAEAEKPALQVFVSVPPTFQPMLDDDIARTLAYRLEDTFRRQGYKGIVGFAAHPSDIKATVPLLQLTLVEWRVDLTNNVQCTFSAKLTDSGKETTLGIFAGTGITWTRARDRWRLATAFEDSANDALKDLYRRIAEQKLLPGFELKKKK